MSATLVVKELAAGHGDRALFSGLDLVVAPGDVIGLVGANGAGKSTLLRTLAGLLPTEAGGFALNPPTAIIGYLPQEPDRREGESLLRFLARRTGVADAQARMDAAVERIEQDPDGYSDALERWLALGGADLEERAAAVAADLRATPTAVAVAWAGRQPGVTSVIIGPRTVEQLADNLAGFDLDLPAPAAARLDEDPADLVRRYFTMWRTGDASTVDTLLAPDWTDHGHPSVRCPADVAAAVTPIPVRLDTVLTDGATVTATGRVGDTELVWVFRTHEGRLRSLRTYR